MAERVGKIVAKRARNIMTVIVVVVIDRECIGGFRAKQADILGAFRNRFWAAGTTDMTVEAQYAITARHDDVEIV